MALKSAVKSEHRKRKKENEMKKRNHIKEENTNVFRLVYSYI